MSGIGFYKLWYENVEENLIVKERRIGFEKISELEIKIDVDCYECFKNNTFNCENCSIFDSDFFIRWDDEIQWSIAPIKELISPFWIVPRQSHWYYNSISEHSISGMFYRFKSGNKCYARVFAFGILKALSKNSRFKKAQLDYIIGIPLSPEKINDNEFDRVSELCKICSREMNICYLKNALSLSEPISRRDYKLAGKSKNFLLDYYKFLQLKTPELNNKTILLVDDVLTDGETLRTASYKINDCYPESKIYAATGGIMAIKNNMKFKEIQKFKNNIE